MHFIYATLFRIPDIVSLSKDIQLLVFNNSGFTALMSLATAVMEIATGWGLAMGLGAGPGIDFSILCQTGSPKKFLSILADEKQLHAASFVLLTILNPALWYNRWALLLPLATCGVSIWNKAYLL